MPVESVAFQTVDGLTLKGWYACPDQSRSGIVLLHQYGGNRLSMINRAEWLCRQGYAVLVYDARAHGESEGERISLGYREHADLTAALSFLREQGLTDLACIGWSQGGATILMAARNLAGVRCVVLESAFDTMTRSIDRGFRKHVGLPGWLVGGLYSVFTEHKLEMSVEAFRPIDHAEDLACPVLVLSGSEDKSTWASDTRELFDAAPEPKQLWIIDGAHHEDLFAFAPQEYRDTVGSFLKKYLPLNTGTPGLLFTASKEQP